MSAADDLGRATHTLRFALAQLHAEISLMSEAFSDEDAETLVASYVEAVQTARTNALIALGSFVFDADIYAASRAVALKTSDPGGVARLPAWGRTLRVLIDAGAATQAVLVDARDACDVAGYEIRRFEKHLPKGAI